MQLSWHHSPRVAEAATVRAAEVAEAKAAATTMAVGTKPHEERKQLCTNCNKVIANDPATCLSLKANKDKRPTGWGTKRGE